MASVVSARQLLFSCICIVADLGEGPGARTPLILHKKEETTEGRKAGRGSKTQSSNPPHPTFAEGLDAPLLCTSAFP